jgi:transposase-like protein
MAVVPSASAFTPTRSDASSFDFAQESLCHACKRTFAETQGTPLLGLHYPIWVVVLVQTLLALGCSVPAILAAFGLDERTVAVWQSKAGQHGERLQDQVICAGQIELGQVQADEICVTAQGGKVWMATAISVFARLFIWGEVSLQRNRPLIERLMQKVGAAASGVQAVLLAVDGLAATPRRRSRRSTPNCTLASQDARAICPGQTCTLSKS